MTSLTQTAIFTRQALKFILVAWLVFILGRFSLNAAVSVWQQLNPEPPPPPTFGFGVLPQIDFPPGMQEYDLEYRLETPTGRFPDTPHTLPVFQVLIERPNLLALDRSNSQARALGFVQEPRALNESLYRWLRVDPIVSTLDMHIYRGTFSMWVDWYSDPGYTLLFRTPTEPQAIGYARRFLDTGSVMPRDLSEGRIEVSFLRASGTNYLSAVSLSEADFVKVDFFRQDINQTHPVMTPDPTRGLVEIIVSGDSRISHIISAEYTYLPIDYTSFQTYPIKPAPTAWDEFNSGQGYIARSEVVSGIQVIRRMSLAYLDTYEPQNYLQPVWVMYGDNDFTAYVPAAMSQIPGQEAR